MKSKFKILFPLSVVLTIILFSSCLQSGLDDFPEWEKNLIDNAYVEVRFNTGQNYNDQPVVGYQKLTITKQVIDTIANTVNLTLSIPAASGDFKTSIRNAVSLTNIFIYFDISTAATMKGIDGTPNPGYKTDASKALTYEVVAANGLKRKWTVTIDPLPIINKYDGTYTLTGTMIDYSNANLTGKYPGNISLVTQDANSVAFYDNDAKDYYHRILNGTSDSYYGSFAPVFIFDSNNNVIRVENKYGQPSSNGRSAELDPSGVNKWDPVTKILKVKYWMNQPSVFTPHRVLFDETFAPKE